MFAAVRLSLSFLTRKQRLTYFSLVVLRSLTGLLDVVGIGLIGLIAGIGVSQFGSASGVGAPVKILGITLPAITSEGLLWLVIFVLVVFLFKAAAAILLSWKLASLVADIESENAGKIADYLLRGSLDSVKQFSKAEFQWAITGSTIFAFTGLLNNVATLASEGFLLVVVAATFFFVNPLAALVALGYFSIIIVIIQVVIGGSLKRAGRQTVEGTVTATSTISDTLDTFREISVLAKQRLFIERISDARRRVSRSGAIITFLGGMPRYVVETALMLGVVIFVGQQFLTGQLASGIVTIGVFLTGGVRIMASLLPLQSALGSIKQNAEQASLAHNFLTKVQAREVATARSDVSADHLQTTGIARMDGLPIVISGATYRYPGDVTDTLHDIRLSVGAGQHVAVIGPSGAGKTTLVDLILGLVHPDSGSVTIGGMEPNDLRKTAPGLISYVPQKPGLVSGTIAENIALGVPSNEIDRELVQEVIAAAYLSEFIAALPDGIDTSVGKQVDSLSGGQIQRIGLARALYTKPQLLILDEATSGLDASSEAFISDSLRKLHGRVTVMIIAHRLSTVQHSDVVHVVENGRITASDDFKTLQATVPMVAEYVRLMSFHDN
jgi:ABC-type multidrug transport system fused ATPase/permease subunit